MAEYLTKTDDYDMYYIYDQDERFVQKVESMNIKTLTGITATSHVSFFLLGYKYKLNGNIPEAKVHFKTSFRMGNNMARIEYYDLTSPFKGCSKLYMDEDIEGFNIIEKAFNKDHYLGSLIYGIRNIKGPHNFIKPDHWDLINEQKAKKKEYEDIKRKQIKELKSDANAANFLKSYNKITVDCLHKISKLKKNKDCMDEYNKTKYDIICEGIETVKRVLENIDSDMMLTANTKRYLKNYVKTNLVINHNIKDEFIIKSIMEITT
jgi:hypothetical protein